MNNRWFGYARFVTGSVLGILGFGEMGQGVAHGVWGAVILGFLFLVVGVALALGSVSARGRNR
jgi:hypothetical protein